MSCPMRGWRVLQLHRAFVLRCGWGELTERKEAGFNMPMAPPPPGAGGAADGPEAWYKSLPIITRCWFTACVASTVTCCLFC